MRDIRSSLKRGVGIKPGGSYLRDLKILCCTMENQELQVEVGQQGSLESPQPSPGSPLPVFLLPVGDASNIMGFYTADDKDDVEIWSNQSRDLSCVSGSFAEEPDISDNLNLFLKNTLRPQWQSKLIQSVGEVLIFQLRAYLREYELLTPFNRRQWFRLFSAWKISGRREQLELLANSSGFQEF